MQKKFIFKENSIKNYAKFNKTSMNNASLFLKEYLDNFERAWGLQKITLGAVEKTRAYSKYYMSTQQFIFVFLEHVGIFWELSYTSFGKVILYNRNISTGILIDNKDQGVITFERVFNIGEDSNNTKIFDKIVRAVSHFDFRKNTLCK